MTLADLMATGSAQAVRLLEAAGWQIVYSTLLLLAVAPLLYLFRRGPALLRYALWTLVLARLAIPVQVALPLNAGAILQTLGPTGELEWLAHESGGSEAPALKDAGMAAGPAGSDRRTNPWPLLILAVWLCGTTTLATRLAARRHRYGRIARRAARIETGPAPDIAARWRRRLNIRRGVRLLASPEAGAPFTIGVLKPAIVLPAAFLESDAGDALHEHDHGTGPADCSSSPDGERDAPFLESVIGHEMAHVRRWDDAQLLAQLAVAAVYFFYPAAWWALARAGEEREQACDELVLSRGSIAPAVYARNLLAALRRVRAGEALCILPALSRGGRRLEARLKRIILQENKDMRASKRISTGPLGLAICALLLTTVAGTSPDTPKDAAARIDHPPVHVQGQAGTQPQLDNPLPGAPISSAYGLRYNPLREREDFHRGIDLRAPSGAPIAAPAPGRVEVATTDYEGGPAFGTVLVIDHGEGMKTLYSHLNSVDVSVGDRVERGQRVAAAGSTGLATGPHLHFEVWVAGEHRNPADFVAEWRVDTPR